MSILNFLLNSVEHEKSLINSGPALFCFYTSQICFNVYFDRQHRFVGRILCQFVNKPFGLQTRIPLITRRKMNAGNFVDKKIR